MTTHEQARPEHPIEPGSDRGFGLVVGGILSLIGGYQTFASSGWAGWLLPLGLLLMGAAVVRPAVLHQLNLGWTRFGVLLGHIVTPVVMFIVFVLTIVPIGFFLRLGGKDPLRLKWDAAAESYWIARTPPGPAPESLKDQF
ncbi:MAG: SxtJ family membrane protein [Pseudomonadales bacterium]